MPTDTSPLLPGVKQLMKSETDIFDLDGLMFLNGKVIITVNA